MVVTDRREKMSKAKIASLAKKLGCEIVIERDYIEAVAPAGKVIGDHQHYSGYGTDVYTKGQIWENLEYDLAQIKDCQGTKFCGCGK
jgi:hypothetical protein